MSIEETGEALRFDGGMISKNQNNPKANADFTAIVLAGCRPGCDPVAQAFGEKYKALVPMVGQPMICHVVSTLDSSDFIKKIIVVFECETTLLDTCPEFEELPGGTDMQIVSCGKSISASVIAAIQASGENWPYLVTTADHPLLTKEMVDHFCTDAKASKGVSVGMVTRTELEASYPESSRTYLAFRDAELSGANLFAFVSDAAKNAIDFWEHIEQQRKKPWKLFKAFGYKNLFGLLMKRFTVDQAFERASEVLGVDTTVVRLPFAEAAIDVDKPLDHDQVAEILQCRASSIAAYGVPAE
ncbi:nucleotidyltransferase family protein [Kordiimonas sp. SCSIO 12610]|uniref:nucleotidyltransferase family protein n=1 Tax=Kordiimonas sp. SCSIO 12610 TaxID=2829597 RepID=UPI002109CC84|nr:nucleotidyltransferase family protein [Kordiimonas sp. SCSIO 12610]